QEFANRGGDLKTLLTTVPGVAGTFAERGQDLATAADDLGKVAAVLAKNEPSLGPLLQQNAELAEKAADLLSDSPARLGRIIPDIEMKGMPNKTMPVPLSPSQQATSDTGLDRLLGGLTGGQK